MKGVPETRPLNYPFGCASVVGMQGRSFKKFKAAVLRMLLGNGCVRLSCKPGKRGNLILIQTNQINDEGIHSH